MGKLPQAAQGETPMALPLQVAVKCADAHWRRCPRGPWAAPSLENEMSILARGLLLSLLAFASLATASASHAQALPVAVDIAGNIATVRIGDPAAPLADLTLDFDDATGLTPAALGINAQVVSLSDPTLLARFPAGSLTAMPSALPLMITVEPPKLGGLVQRRLVHIELHTHALPYTAGSPLRLFKAQLGGNFRDITESVKPGSVRTRGTSPGWSQFVVVADLRPTRSVITEKFAALRASLDAVPAAEAVPLRSDLNACEAAVADGRFDDAALALDSFVSRVSARAGVAIPDTWRATRDVRNVAGELLSGASTLGFSIGVLRDLGS